MPRCDRFLNACRREPVDATPIWLMRQAGRYMPEYRELRKRHRMLELVKNPELAAEITLQPIRAFDVDAAIVFADILTLLEPLGLSLDIVEDHGPRIGNPIRSAGDVDRLRPFVVEQMGFTLEALKIARRQLDGLVPLIGFSGAPFTLACYAIEGGGSKEFRTTRRFFEEQPAAWHRLMEMLTEAVLEYLRAQALAGAQALQIFDTWAGILNEAEYTSLALPYSRRLFAELGNLGDIPRIHFSTRTRPYVKRMRQEGVTVVGIDAECPLDWAWREIGQDCAIQGNLDPQTLLGPSSAMLGQAAKILEQAGGQPGHIFNLGHGVIKETSPDQVARLVEYVHRHSSERARGAS